MMKSYEQNMFETFKMPSRVEVEGVLLQVLFRHGGVIREFSSDEMIVEEMACRFNLSAEQRTARLETIYHKENRKKYANLWNRLLFRAADSLARQKFILKPSQTILLTQRKEWMLTEEGYDFILKHLKIPEDRKRCVRYCEIQKQINEMKSQPVPENYNPVGNTTIVTAERDIQIRKRSFRFAVAEAYNYRCAICGFQLCSPDKTMWEVEAAHIVPHFKAGKDDIWNGLALCRMHHWAFDVGWFGVSDDFHVILSKAIDKADDGLGVCHGYNLLKPVATGICRLFLPQNKDWYPHHAALRWHREHVLHCE